MKILFHVVVLFVFTASFSQSKTDSLQKVLTTTQGDLKVKTLNELFREHINSDPVKAMEFSQQALELATEIDDKKGIAASCNNLGVAYRNHGALDNALEYYMKSLKIYEAIENKEGIATSKNNIGNIHSFKKNFEQAMKYLEESHIYCSRS